MIADLAAELARDLVLKVFSLPRVVRCPAREHVVLGFPRADAFDGHGALFVPICRAKFSPAAALPPAVNAVPVDNQHVYRL